METTRFFGNLITYYDRNFLHPECGKDFIYAIWDINWEYQYHFASFKTKKQLDNFAKKLGFKYKLYKDNFGRITGRANKVLKSPKVWTILHNEDYKPINRAYTITDTELKQAKQIYALCNGSTVPCYYVTTKTHVLIYRPNPNCKEFYKPLSIEEHIKYQEENGIF